MINFLLKSFLIAYSFSYVSSNINPDNVAIAINCGGDDFRDSNGILYQKVFLINQG